VKSFFKQLCLCLIAFPLLQGWGWASAYATVGNALHAGLIQTGEITDKRISEASGIAASRVQDNLFWVINDSGHDASLFAVNSQGKVKGHVEIEGIKNKDWEDLAAFEYQGKPYLLIADVGDNKAKRKHVTLYVIKEPKPKHLSKKDTYKVKPAWRLRFTYEDGARDCESVAVDVKNDKIYLLTKRDTPPVLYELPLQKKPKKQEAVAKRVANIKLSALTLFEVMNRPTAMDISADGSSAIVMTYTHGYLYQSNSLQASKTLFENKPQIFSLPQLKQAEAICFDKKGEQVFMTSEGSPAPLFKLNLQQRLDK